jgi:hypothetical protein
VVKGAGGLAQARFAACFYGFYDGMYVAMQWPMNFALALSFLLTACAMSPTIADAAKARGAADLNCASDRISVAESEGGVVVVRGCGARTRYTCFYSRDPNAGRFTASEAICLTDAPARIYPDLAAESPPVTPSPPAPRPADTGDRFHGNMCVSRGCLATHAPASP